MSARDPIDPADQLSPRELQRVLRGGVVVIALLAAVLVWSLVAAPTPARRGPLAPLATSPQAREYTAEVAAADVKSLADPPPPPPTASRRVVEVTPARRLAGLFGLQLGFLRANDLIGTVAFNEVIRGTPAVKLINLWATWCAPCVREIGMFRALSDGWRRDIRFVPIHVGPVTDPEAYRRLVDRMPPAAESPLIDASGDALLGMLRATTLLEEGEGIPITLLLDCRNELRWMHVGDLPDTAALSERLAALRGELDSPRCAPPEPPASAQPGPPGCGDGTCDRGSEHCANCVADCGCIIGTVCSSPTGALQPSCVVPDHAFSEP